MWCNRAASAKEIEELSAALGTLTPVATNSGTFADIESKFQASILLQSDGTTAAAPPSANVSYQLMGLEEVHNSVLTNRFERERARLATRLTRTTDELKIRFGFHGTMPGAISRIVTYGLLRSGHPLNKTAPPPSDGGSGGSGDPGTFGHPRCGVYISRRADATFKYCTIGGDALGVGDIIRVVMCNVICGKSFQVDTETPHLVPTAGHDSHTSPLSSPPEWYLFGESQVLPTFVLTVRGIPSKAATISVKK